MLKTTCVLRQGMTYSKFVFVACGAPLWSLNITHLFHFPVCALLTQAHERPAGGGAQVRNVGSCVGGLNVRSPSTLEPSYQTKKICF